MNAFVEEVKLIQKIVYKTKNSHRCTLYYKKMVRVNRLAGKYLREKDSKIKSALVEDIQTACMDAYVAVSSNIAIGHNLGMAIGTMAIIARIFSLARRLRERGGVESISYVVDEENIESDRDAISDIFNS